MSIADRQNWLSILAKAPTQALQDRVASMDSLPPYKVLRVAEIGAVMVQGRMGGTGDVFNLGEMTVSRCSVELQTGEIGHGYVQGRNRDKVRLVAILDALLQTHRRDHLMKTIISPLQAQMAKAKSQRAAKAATTKVDFFTLARGED